jgi:hypothetical protein
MERHRQKELSYPINEEPIFLSKPLLDLLLKEENSADLIALYCFYYYTAKWQGTSQPRATSNFTMAGLNWGETRFIKAKRKLRELNLIEDIAARAEGGRVFAHYIKLKFLWSNSSITTPPAHHPGGKTGSNALKTNSNITTSDFVESDGEDINKKITPSMFDQMWRMYPKKVDKGKAKTAWLKICRKPSKDRPTWREIKSAIRRQSKSERWQTSKFIPHATTWLNQSRWLDDAEEMKLTDFNKEQQRYTCPNGWEFGKAFSASKQGCMDCEDYSPKIYAQCKLTNSKTA